MNQDRAENREVRAYVRTILSTFLRITIFLFFVQSLLSLPSSGSFILIDPLDKPWSQVPSLVPPGSYLHFLSRIGFIIPPARRFSSNIANSRSRASRESFFVQEKSLTNVHSVRLEPTKLILVGPRTTYQATGGAGYVPIKIGAFGLKF